MKIVFLILHYKVIEETINCIESILDYNHDNIEIVIVDNGSNNGTGEKLVEKYKQNNIHIIINKNNLGFARGNNVGFEYAKKELHADFIVMANNDIIFYQKEFCLKIINLYEKYDYAVLGPKVLMPTGKFAVFNTKLNSIKKQYIFLFSQYIRLFLATIYLDKIFPALQEKRIKKRNIKKDNYEIKTEENVILYGCCLIFSPKYVKLFDGIDDRTFLYAEEQLLYIRLMRNNLKSLYCVDVEIKHNHSVSTNKSLNNNRKREIFVARNQIKSGKILLKELKEYYKSVQK